MGNDDIFNFLYEEECKKIPFFLRFSERRLKASMVLLGVLFTALCIVSFMAQGTAGFMHIIYAGVLVAIVSSWMVLAAYLEKKAFRKASQLAFKYRLAERERIAERIQRMRMETSC